MEKIFYSKLINLLQKMETSVALALASAEPEDPDRQLLEEILAILGMVKKEWQPMPRPKTPTVIKGGGGKNPGAVVAGAVITADLTLILTLLKILALLALTAVLYYLYRSFVAPRLEAIRMRAILSGLVFASAIVQDFQQVRARLEREINRYSHCRNHWELFIAVCDFLMQYARHPSDAYPVIYLSQQRDFLSLIESNINRMVALLERLFRCIDPRDTTGFYDEIIGPSGRVRIMLNRVRTATREIYTQIRRIRRPRQLQPVPPPGSGQ